MNASQDEVRAILLRMGWGGAVGAVEPLTGGVSGAASYRLALPEGAAVLKVMAADAEPYQRERAARELAFYRELAPRLPLRTPQLLAAAGNAEEGVTLLLRAYDSPRDLRALADDALERVVAQLVALHVATQGQDWAQRYPWLRAAPAPATADEFAHAVTMWQAQAAYAPLLGVITADTLAALPGWFEALQRTEHRLAGWPLALAHNDCHLGNVLWDGDTPVWSDWQEVGLGWGPGELSFLLQRGCGPGDDDAFAHWSGRYAALLAAQSPDHPDPALTLQVMDCCELRMRLLAWPHYFDWIPREAVAHQLVRLAQVAARLAAL